MANIATFGEIMLRLSPPGKELLFQSPELRAAFGGAEANVAVSLALWGHRSRWISVVPRNRVGDAALAELRRHGVEVGEVVRAGRRLGIYFAETGANERSSRVLYDREGSGVAEAGPGAIDWAKALEGMDRLHVSGITPALSATAAALTLEGVEAARKRDMIVSLDLNYRAKLWKYGREAPEVMRGLAERADLLVGNEEDYQKALGLGGGAAGASGAAGAAAMETKAGPLGGAAGGGVTAARLDRRLYDALTAEALAAFPKLARAAVTLRESLSADWNRWSAVMRVRDKGASRFLEGPVYEIRAVVDRVGTGDAFAAGLLHGLETFAGPGAEAEALEFAVAAGALKHSIPGDFNLAHEKDVLAAARGDRSGRVRR